MDHSFPTMFSKSTLTTRTRVRLLPIREQVGCRLKGREDPLWFSFPTMNEAVTCCCQEQTVSLWPLSEMSHNLCCISKKYRHHFVTCVSPREDLLVQQGCLWKVSNASYRRVQRFYKMMGKGSRGKLHTVLRSPLLSPGFECLSGDSSVSTDMHLGTACLEGLRYKQVKTQNFLLCLVFPVQ